MSSITSSTFAVRKAEKANSFASVSQARFQPFITLDLEATFNQSTPDIFGFGPYVISGSHAYGMQRRHRGKTKLKCSRVSVEFRFKYLSGSDSNAVSIYQPGLMREIPRIQCCKTRANTRNINSHEHCSAGIDSFFLFNRINDLVHNSRRVMQERQKTNQALLLHFSLPFSLDISLPFELKAHCPYRTSNCSNRTNGLHPRSNVSRTFHWIFRKGICKGAKYQKDCSRPHKSLNQTLNNSVHLALTVLSEGSKA